MSVTNSKPIKSISFEKLNKHMPEYTIVEFSINMSEVYYNDIVLLVKLCYTKSCMPLLFMSYYQGTLFLNMLSWENGFSYLPTYITSMRSNIAFWKMPVLYQQIAQPFLNALDIYSISCPFQSNKLYGKRK